MTYLDWIIVGFVLIGFISGYFRGFISQIFNILALVLGYFAARLFASQLSVEISKLIPSIESQSSIIAFAVIFIAVLIVVKIIAMWVEKAVDFAQLESMNRLLGLIFGGVKYLFFLLILDIALSYASLPSQEDISKSKFYKIIRGQSNLVLKLVDVPASVEEIVK